MLVGVSGQTVVLRAVSLGVVTEGKQVKSIRVNEVKNNETFTDYNHKSTRGKDDGSTSEKRI